MVAVAFSSRVHGGLGADLEQRVGLLTRDEAVFDLDVAERVLELGIEDQDVTAGWSTMYSTSSGPSRKLIGTATPHALAPRAW